MCAIMKGAAGGIPTNLRTVCRGHPDARTHPLMMRWWLFLPDSTTWFARKKDKKDEQSKKQYRREGGHGGLEWAGERSDLVCSVVARPVQLSAYTPCLLSGI